MPAAPPAAPGLTTAAVEASRAAHGANVLTPPARDPWWRLYLAKFDDPVIRILLIAAGLAVAVGLADGHLPAEGVGILVAVFLATFLGFWNEHRAGRAFDVLNQTNDDVPVKVYRDGGVTTVPRRDVVVGDAVVVEAGEEVPADGRVRSAVGLAVSEAKLTGEARPVDKAADDEVRRGAVVADGYGLVEVEAVGDRTEFGRTLTDSMRASGKNRTLAAQLSKLSRIIGVVGFAVAVVAFAALVGRSAAAGTLVLTRGQWAVAGSAAAGVAVALVMVWLPIVFDGLALAGLAARRPGWLDGGGLKAWAYAAVLGGLLFATGAAAAVLADAVPADPGGWLPRAAGRQLLRDFMIAVTIIVVAVPEGLAMSVTLSLAYSMRKMTATNTLVRRMDATETIGAATVICSDKTGTLTQNEMRVAEAAFAGRPPGPDLPAGRVRSLVAQAAAANSTAHLERRPGEPPRAVGNPTEAAVLLWLDAHGVDYAAARAGVAVRDQMTFNTDRKLMATAGGGEVHVKGAPEIVLARCGDLDADDGPRPLTDADRKAVAAAVAGYQARGMRTLAFAYRPDVADTPVEELLDGLVWLGFVAIADPVRADVPAAVADCQAAGIVVKVVTGDSPATATEIARGVGLWGAAEPATAHRTGPEFAALSDADAAAAAGDLKVMSRARPADKLRLVQLLKQRGEVVAVTGDGVNDGPALNHADVGLAMGKTGTAVAKEASDIVLLDDSFASIVTAVRWGRTLYENIQRFILFQLTINVAALGLAVLGPFVGVELPLTVMQMLWVNLIMDTFAALALATEPPHPGVMGRPPRDPAGFIVTRRMAAQIFGTGAAFLACLLWLIAYLAGSDGPPASDAPTRGGTILFTVFVLLQFWNLFNAKCLGRAGSVVPALGTNPSFLLIAGFILAGQVLIVQFGGAVFRTVPLAIADWLAIVGGTSVVLWAGELGRLAAGRRAG